MRAVLAFYPEILVIGEAPNGEEALQLVAEYQPDVVVMDLQLPVMDGLEATRLIKNRWPATKVIVLTMQSLRRAEALAAGADIFLLKDSEPEILWWAIRNDAMT